jgi:hypothetical protein
MEGDLLTIGQMPTMPAQQEWVTRLSIMMQSVLFAAVRAPDGLRKRHPVKVIMRWYRRSVLISAFDGRPLDNPFVEGGGSFTGPFTVGHAHEFARISVLPHIHRANQTFGEEDYFIGWEAMDRMIGVYLDHVDEMPHHFQLHMMHAAQIVGSYHPNQTTREWWMKFYLTVVNDAHLRPELPLDLDLRLSDNEQAWRRRESLNE